VPRRSDISKVLIIGSGPIIIGQAAEFDYAGTQACKALREEGVSTVLVNSNPATIMTDPELADRTYVEPVTPEWVARVIERGLVKDGRLVRINIRLLDKPGQLTIVSGIISGLRANVIEVHHSRAFSEKFGDTTLLLTLETRGPEHVAEILGALRELGYQVDRV